MTATDTPHAVPAGRYDLIVLGLLALSLSANLALGFGLVRLASIPTPVKAASPAVPLVGAQVPALELENLRGSRETIRFDGGNQRTFIYVFSPSCNWCERNLRNLHAVSKAVKASGFRLIGISLDALVESYIHEKGIDFPVHIRPSAATIQAYGIGVTPQTFLVSESGTVEKVWTGAYVGESQKELEVVLSTTLPGLIQIPRTNQ